MEISALTLRVLLLFFPGVLCAMIVDAFTVHRQRTTAQFLTNAFVLGMGTYLLLYAIRAACAVVAHAAGWPPPLNVTFFSALTDDKLRIAWGEIGLSVVVAVLLGIAVVATINHRLLFTAARRLRLSRQSGELDLWGLFLSDTALGWVTVRDPEHDLAYEGWVEAFSETADRAELILKQVRVYRNSSGSALYDSELIYLSRQSDTITIERLDELNRGPDAPDERRERVAAAAGEVQ